MARLAASHSALTVNIHIWRDHWPCPRPAHGFPTSPYSLIENLTYLCLSTKTARTQSHNKPLRLFSYQTKERLHYTHGPRSSRVPRPASATLCAAAQRRNCRGNANTARGKDAQHNMLGNFAAGRFFESLEPSQHCGASNNARVQAPCQPSPWVDRTHLFEMPCAAKLFEYGF